MKRRVPQLALAALAAGALLTACSAPTTESDDGSGVRDMSLTFAYITPETFPYQDGGERFKELVEESSDGKITVELFPGGQLGDERAIEESILSGSIQIGIGAGALAGFAPIMNVFELPFLIEGQEHLASFVESEVAATIADRIREDGGFQVVAWYSTGDAALETNRPINEPSDLNGLKIRTQENPAQIDALTALGASPTPMAFTEVFSGLETGVIDGTALDWGSVSSLKLATILSHATSPDVPILAQPRPVIVSAEWWDGLSDEEQTIIGDAIQAAAQYEREVFVERQAEAIASVEAEGMTFTEIDRDEFLKLVDPVWQKWADDLDAADILDQIRALVD